MSESTVIKFGVGDHITIVDGEPITTSNADTGEPIVLGSYGDALKGNVLKVLAIDGPFLVVEDLSDTSLGRLTIDIRRVLNARVLSKEYVAAAIGKRRWWHCFLPRWCR